jgi:phage-related minor tail protein
MPGDSGFKIGSAFVEITTHDETKAGYRSALAGAGAAGASAGKKAGARFSGAMATASRAKGKLLGGVAAAAGAAKIVKGFYNIGATADDMRLTLIKATDASGKHLKNMQQISKNIATKFPVNFHDAASAVGQFSKVTGATGKDLQHMAGVTAELSRITGTDATKNANMFAHSLRQWKVPAAQGSEQIKKLYKASQDADVPMGQLVQTFNKYSPSLAAAGFNMDQSIGIFDKLGKSGLDVRKIMPGLNRAFKDYAERNIPVQKGLAGTIKKMKNAKSPTEALKIATDEFGQSAGPQLAQAVRTGALDSLDNLTGSLKGADGTFKHSSKGTQALSEKMKILGNKIKVGLMPFALKIFDILAKIGGWMAKHTTTVEIFAGVIAGALTAGFIAWAAGAASAAAATIAATWPVLAIAAGIAALIAVVVLLVKHWDTVKKVAKKVWDAVKSAVMVPVHAIVNWFTKTFIPFFTQTIPGVFQSVINWLKKHWPLIAQIMIAIFLPGGIIIAAIWHFKDQILGVFKSIWNWIKGTFSKIWNGVKAVIVSPVEAAWRAVKKVWGWITGKFRSSWTWINKTFRKLWDGAKKIVTHPVDLAWKSIKKIWGWVTGKFKSSWVWVSKTFRKWWNGVEHIVTKPVKIARNWVRTFFNNITSKFRSAWNWVAKTFKRLWNGVENIVRNPVKWARNSIRTWFNNITGKFRSAWDWVSGTFKRLWHGVEEIIKKPIRLARNGIRTLFNSITGRHGILNRAKSTIKSIWNGIKSIFKAPVNFVIRRVYDKGIRRIWNDTAGKIGLPDMPYVHPLAKGGTIPGYSPGNDRYHAVLSPGEGVLVPEAVRGLGGPGAINYLNNKFAPRTRGHAGQYRVSPEGLPMFGWGWANPVNWAKGAYHGLKNVANTAKGLVGAGLDWTKKGASWIGNHAKAAAGWVVDKARQGAANAVVAGMKAAEKPVRALFRLVPGSGKIHKMFTKMPGRIMNKANNKVYHWVRGNNVPKKGGSYSAGGSAKAVYHALRNIGFSKIEAAGIMGNMQSESGFDPHIVQGGGHSLYPSHGPGVGYGLVQWTPGSKLIPYLGGATPNIKNEVNALTSQLLGRGPSGESYAGYMLRHAHSAAQAANYFGKYYERYAGPPQAARAAQARRWFNTFDTGHGMLPPGFSVAYNGKGHDEYLRSGNGEKASDRPHVNSYHIDNITIDAHSIEQMKNAADFFNNLDQTVRSSRAATLTRSRR